MQPDRVMNWSEARSDYRTPSRRATPRPRAEVLPADPAWLHEGLTMRLTVRGVPTDFFAASVMAAALHRSPETLRRLIRQGIVPEARYYSPGQGRFGRKRLWRREVILATAELVDRAGLRGRPRRWADSSLPAALADSATS